MIRCASAALAALALVAVAPAAPAPPPSAVLATLSKPPTVPAIASQRIYFVMTDRYANGDPSNDRGGLTGGPAATGFDPGNTGYFHGGDFKGLTGDCEDEKNGLARLKDLGFTAIWVTPPVVQRTVQGDSAAYHGYWGLDFTRVDPHLGTNDDFAAFTACAHKLGLKVYMDVVVNHTADVIIPTGGSTYSDVPFKDCHGHVFDPARYVAAKRFPCLNVQNMPRVPVVLPADRNAKSPAWLNDPTKYHDRGDVDFSSCSEQCLEQGDFFGLDDLFTEQPAVMNGLAAIYADWIRRYKLDGFRIDTARHVNAAFFRLWVPKILAAARAAGVPDFQLFGEVFVTDDVELSRFVRDRGLPNVLDFPFQDKAAGYASGQSAKGLARRLEEDDYFRTGNGVDPMPPTFLGNHDMGRAAQQIQSRSGAAGDQLLKRVLLGDALLYLLRGAPVVYYGDEVGMIGRGGDKAARQDMFPTQVAEWQTEPRVGSPPIGRKSSFDVDSPIAERLKELAKLRDENPALSTGAFAVRYAEQGLLVVSRIDLTGRREYVAAFNSGTTAAGVRVSTATPGASWDTLFGDAKGASAADGRLTLVVPALGAVLLRAKDQVPVRTVSRPVVKVAPDDFSSLFQAKATVTGGPVTVAFAIKRGAGGWHRLAIDDSAPYRAFFPRFKPNEPVQVVAVARGLDGKTAVSAVTRATLRR